MRTIILISLALMLSACASDNYYWQHRMKGPNDYEGDAYVCNVDAQRARTAMSRELKDAEYAEAAMDNEYESTFESCMEAMGWFKVKE